jgi:hypothetical protein
MTVFISRGVLGWLRSWQGRRAAADGSAAVRLYAVRPVLVANARSAAILGMLSGAVAVLILDWSAVDVVLGAGIGVLLWGFVWFLGTRELVPCGALLAAPADAVVDLYGTLDTWPRTLLRTLWVVPLSAGAAWLADHWDLGALFVPGQFFGIAAAYLVSAWLVARWERAHRERAVFREHHADAELYAAPSVALNRRDRGVARSGRRRLDDE